MIHAVARGRQCSPPPGLRATRAAHHLQTTWSARPRHRVTGRPTSQAASTAQVRRVVPAGFVPGTRVDSRTWLDG
jgi:hypothetical protein